MTKRYSAYRKFIKQIQEGVRFESFWDAIQHKILVYMDRNPDESLRKIKKEMHKIFGSEYEDFVDEVFYEYDGIIDYVNKKYKDLGIDIDRNMERIVAIEKVNKTRLGEYEKKEVDKISRYLRKAIIERKPSRELARDLKKIGGRVESYADTIARSQIAGYGRESRTAKAISGGVFYAEYVGFIQKHTRDFCRERLGHNSPRGDNHYHIDEINNLSNGPKQLKPEITYCGGWNCNHDWEWDASYKPDDKTKDKSKKSKGKSEK